MNLLKMARKAFKDRWKSPFDRSMARTWIYSIRRGRDQDAKIPTGYTSENWPLNPKPTPKVEDYKPVAELPAHVMQDSFHAPHPQDPHSPFMPPGSEGPSNPEMPPYYPRH